VNGKPYAEAFAEDAGRMQMTVTDAEMVVNSAEKTRSKIVARLFNQTVKAGKGYAFTCPAIALKVAWIRRTPTGGERLERNRRSQRVGARVVRS